MGRLMVIIAALALACGCARECRDNFEACAQQMQETACCKSCSGHAPVEVVAVADVPARHPSLIFDRRPGVFSAEQFTGRSDWPSTLGYIRAPEIIFYREHFRDYQPRGWSLRDWTYRRFETVRQGAAVR